MGEKGMGEKGVTQGPGAAEAADHLVDELTGLGDAAVTSKKMFGGFGIFADGVMFGIVDSAGTSFLRTGDGNRDDFEAAGSAAHGRMPYHEIPPNILRNHGELRAWASRSLEISRAARK